MSITSKGAYSATCIFPKINSLYFSFKKKINLNKFFTGKIANGITKNDDPILGDDYACVFWFGDKNKNDNCPIISVKKGNDNIETITYVNRVLIFLYAGLDRPKKNKYMHRWVCNKCIRYFFPYLLPF